MASVLLPWRVGGQRALDLCVSGRVLRAAEALEVGLLSAVAEEPGRWWEDLVTQRLSKMSASSLRFAERAARMGLQRDLDSLLPLLEQLYLEDLMKTPDANEGIASFIERRAPAFSHTPRSPRNCP
jgi:cyclohexa-1,5-dienecarbonyl-CoA hydratase